MGAAAAAAASLSIATPLCPVLLVGSTLEINSNSNNNTNNNNNNNNNSTTISFPSRRRTHDRSRKLIIVAATKGSTQSSKPEENNIPYWAKPDSAEPPPWAQNDSSDEAYQVPFYVYLLASAITAIAAIGSIFEYINEKPVFGVLNSDSVFYAPLLGFFAFTGIPTSAFLWYKSVQTTNKAAEEQDRKDGYR